MRNVHTARPPLRASRSSASRLKRHAWWLGLLAALLAALLVLWARSAAAQTQRGLQIIERALKATPDRERGAALYRAQCASCHGKAAHGDMKTVTPALAGQVLTYTIKQLADMAEGDRTTPEMHHTIARKELSTPQALRDVATYLKELPPLRSPEVGDGARLALGAEIFRKTCAQCHGAQGEGDERYAAPALQRQHYSYLLRQMRQLAVGHRYAVDIEVIELLEAMDLDELTAVADYASRLPSTPPEPVARAQARK